VQIDSTKRFTDRVDDYVKYRPDYPQEVLDLLKSRFGLAPSHVVVDVGSGTGISSELFLKNGNIVFGVEPNEAMREAAETQLIQYSNFLSIAGTAESTTLPSACADFIVVAQAFHWFAPEPTRTEFRRILKPEGWVVIVFNDRNSDGSGFSIQYDEVLKEFGKDYKTAKHRNRSEQRHREFLGEYQEFYFPHLQELDFPSCLGRLKSSSYAPKEVDPRFPDMVNRLKEIFDEHQQGGRITMEYTTRVFCSRLA
jgi:SAM-dependent methyltransferase